VTSTAIDPWAADTSWHPVSGKLMWVRLISLGLGAVPLLLGLWLLWTFAPLPVVVSATVFLTAVLIFRAVMVVRAVRSWGYAEREQELLVRHGVMIRRLSIVPYGRMQFVDVSAGPLERAFGLATVQLHTAAAASDAMIPGLEPQAAARLRDRLAALGRTRSEGL
jgi:membrane protein YdbS with pleckstrin-like domain